MTIRILLISLISFLFAQTSLYAQSPTFTIQQNMKQRRAYIDSVFKLPAINSNRTFATNQDSIGQLWMRPDSVKLFGRFPGNIIKALATEDSLIFGGSNIKNQYSSAQLADYAITGNGSATKITASNAATATFARSFVFATNPIDTAKQLWSFGIIGTAGGAPFHSGGDLAFRSYTTAGVPLSSGSFPFRMSRGGNTTFGGTINSGAITSTGNIVAGVGLQAANGLFHDGSKAESRDTTVTGSYTMLSNDLYIYVNNAADCTITLFAPVSTAPAKGRVVYVKKISDNAATVTVVVANGATIDDAASVVITAYNNSLMFRDNGTNYKIH